MLLEAAMTNDANMVNLTVLAFGLMWIVLLMNYIGD